MTVTKILALVMLMAFALNVNADGDIPLEPGIINTGSHGGGHKSPVQTPQVWIEDYKLTFDASCVGCMIEIVQEDVVVYTTFVDLNGEVTLPSTLSGTLQLRLYYADITFIGEFEL